MEALSRQTILAIGIVLEAALLLLAAAWIYFAHIDLLKNFQFSGNDAIWGIAFAAISSSLALLATSLGKHHAWLAELRQFSQEILMPLVKILTPLDILLLSLVSGFCEEVFFRAVLQTQIGLLPAALFFGFFHDPSLKQRSYVLMAALAGLGLGYLYQASGSIWSCIIAHSLHNLIAMTVLHFSPAESPEAENKVKEKAADSPEAQSTDKDKAADVPEAQSTDKDKAAASPDAQSTDKDKAAASPEDNKPQN